MEMAAINHDQYGHIAALNPEQYTLTLSTLNNMDP